MRWDDDDDEEDMCACKDDINSRILIPFLQECQVVDGVVLNIIIIIPVIVN